MILEFILTRFVGCIVSPIIRSLLDHSQISGHQDL